MAVSYLPKDTLKDFLQVLKCFQNTLPSTHHLLSFTKAVKLPSALLKWLCDVDLTVTCLSSNGRDFTGHPSSCTSRALSESGNTVGWPGGEGGQNRSSVFTCLSFSQTSLDGRECSDPSEDHLGGMCPFIIQRN